jgi:hypothetical protein
MALQGTDRARYSPAPIQSGSAFKDRHCAYRGRAAIIRNVSRFDFPTWQDLHDPGQPARSGFSLNALPDHCRCEANLGAETGARRFSDIARYIQYKVQKV